MNKKQIKIKDLRWFKIVQFFYKHPVLCQSFNRFSYRTYFLVSLQCFFYGEQTYLKLLFSFHRSTFLTRSYRHSSTQQHQRRFRVEVTKATMLKLETSIAYPHGTIFLGINANGFRNINVNSVNMKQFHIVAH